MSALVDSIYGSRHPFRQCELAGARHANHGQEGLCGGLAQARKQWTIGEPVLKP